MANQKWDMIVNENKPTLTYRIYNSTNKQSTKYSLVVPGYGNHVDLHDEMCNYLADNEITTMVVNLEGHGTSFGNRFSVNSFDDYCDNIKRAIERLKLECNLTDNFDLTLIGHSQGGLASHYYKEKFDNKNEISKLALLCPFYGLKSPISKTNYYFLKTLNFILSNKIINVGGTSESVCDNNNWLIRVKNDFLSQGTLVNTPGAGVTTPAWYFAATDAQNFIQNNAKTTCPILFVNVNDDQVVDSNLIKNMFTKLNNPSSQQLEVVGKHDLPRCVNRFIVFDSIISFINKS